MIDNPSLLYSIYYTILKSSIILYRRGLGTMDSAGGTFDPSLSGFESARKLLDEDVDENDFEALFPDNYLDCKP